MTTEEKLKHFQDICMTDARERSARMLDDYMNALEAAFEEHAADARRRADMQVEAETEKLEREINKRLSIGQLDLKRRPATGRRSLRISCSWNCGTNWPTLWRHRITSGFWTAR